MITRALLRAWGACWSDEEISDVSRASGRTSMTPRELAKTDNLTLLSRLWVVCHALGHRNETAARIFAIDEAARVSSLAGSGRDQDKHARLIANLRRIFALAASSATQERELASWTHAWMSSRLPNSAWFAAMAATHKSAGESAFLSAREAAFANWGRCLAKAASAMDRALHALGSDAEGWDEQEVTVGRP